MQKIPRRLIADVQRTAQLNGRNAAFVRGTEIDRPESGRRRQVRAVHDRPCCDGRLMPAGAALERVPPANWVIFRTAAFRADEAVWKPKPELFRPAALFRAESGAKFLKCDALCVCHANDPPAFSEIIVSY